MTYASVEELPREITEQLPKHGQQLFMAAYNATLENGMNDENATQVAWNSVKARYEKDENGNWVATGNAMADRGNIVGTETDTSDPIGNRENNAGTMRGG
ncbi:ChaB family protein [Cyanothece sp. BG0011]|uniref:ChaB family protein n=1 Tax=Cyanothece sp. BG0011 TaxID=2082950 RepID=UPI000D1F87A7|nr:ChaB family protein [Cyanothece sp. BG0011]